MTTALNTWVAGDPAGTRATSAWLRTMQQRVHNAAGGPNNAITASLEGWDGAPAQIFRRIMTRTGLNMDDLARTGFGSFAEALDRHADDLDTVKARMQQARDVAAQGGLTVTETEIQDPGDPPPDPPPVSHNTPEFPAQQGTRGLAENAKAAYLEKVKAYTEASLTVSGARDIENTSVDTLLSYLQNVGEKWHINAADFGTGLAAATLAQHTKLAGNAQYFKSVANEAFKLADDTGLTAAQRAQAIITGCRANARYYTDFSKTEAQAAGKLLDKMPRWVKDVVLGELDHLTNSPGLNKIPGLEKAVPVLKKIPVAGTALTAGSIGLDVAQGKDPTTAVVSNVGALGAGVLVGGLIGGPIGAAAGFLVSTGTGWAIENLMSPQSQAIIEQMNKPEVQENLPWYLRNPFS